MKFRLVENKNRGLLGKPSIKIDTVGNELSKEQIEYFKNTKVKDNNKLQICIHGSRDHGNFSVLDPSRCNNKILYFSDNLNVAKHFSYSNSNAIYYCYLNITNPLIIDANNKSYQEIPFQDNIYTADEIGQIALQMNYDGVIIKNVLEHNEYLCTDYIIFKSNQAKRISNKFPTAAPEIDK